MKKLAILLTALTLTAVADTNVSGKWSGSFIVAGPDGDKPSTAYLVLKQTGTEVTGTGGPTADDQHLTVKGSIDGDRITLVADHEGMKIKFDLVLSDGHMRGEANMTGEQGQSGHAKIDVTPVK